MIKQSVYHSYYGGEINLIHNSLPWHMGIQLAYSICAQLSRLIFFGDEK